MSSNNFLDQFQISMNKLNESRRKIETGVQMNDQFTNTLKERLTQINVRLRDFSSQIQKLKDTADSLKASVDNNSTSIGEKERQIQELNNQISKSQQERDALVAAATEEKKQLQTTINNKQGQIDQDENRLRELENQLNVITDEKNKLEAELRGKGDLAAQHADALDKFAQDAQQSAQQREQEYQQKEKQLTDRINECDNKIQEYQNQILEKDNEIARINQEHDATRGTAQMQSKDLEKQIIDLKQQNELLINNIIAATQAINEAADQLNDFSTGINKASSVKELNDMLVEIEQSIGLISRALQGQTPSVIPDNTEVTVTDSNGGQPMTMTYAALKNSLQRKIVQVRKTNPNMVGKYITALENVSKAQNVNEIPSMLVGLAIKNTDRGLEVTGGRKTKKKRTQNGGFTYKSTSRRRSISSTPKSTVRSRRSSR